MISHRRYFPILLLIPLKFLYVETFLFHIFPFKIQLYKHSRIIMLII